MRNKTATFITLITLFTLLISPMTTEARGGGRGGGGSGSRGGSAYRGGSVMNRTPTMSRTLSTPAVSQTRQLSTPTASQVRQQITRPAVSQSSIQQAKVQQSPSAASRAELRDQVNRYAQSRPVQNINSQDVTQRTQSFSRTRDTQITQNRQFSERVNQRVQQNHPTTNWFNQDFFDRHNVNVDYARTGANLWRPATWATLATWGSWQWSTPYYYDYGGDVYPVDTSGSPYASSYMTPSTYYQPVQPQSAQEAQIITTDPTKRVSSASTGGGDWLPLGVFAIASNGNSATQTNRFIQLALNRSGELAGVIYNSATDIAQDLVGMVNPHTQKAYWSMANRADSPIASTGIYNLTEDKTPINVHFSDGTNQTWNLVRLQGQ